MPMSLGRPILDALDVLQILHNSWRCISIIQLLGSITRSLMSAEVRDGTGALCSYRLTGCGLHPGLCNQECYLHCQELRP